MFDHAVVGAGIHGLCTAFWLRQRSRGSIVVLDRHGPAHDFGSSHGDTRIFRSSYPDDHFVQLAVQAHTNGWPAIERALGRPLRTPTPGVFFGPRSGPFGAYLDATARCAALTPLAVEAAQDRFPLRFEPGDEVLLDATAAVILAADTMQGLRDWLQTHDVTFAWNTPVLELAPNGAGIELTTANGVLSARSTVLATGAFLAAPQLQTAVTVLRQQVGYFDLELPPAAQSAGDFPVWARIGATANEFDYGLPSHRGRGVKVARHRTVGTGIDPDSAPAAIDEEALWQLARRRFSVTTRSLRATEHCLYGMTSDQGFRLVRHPQAAIVSVAACSGHGFKFGPVIGQQACDLLLA